MGIRQTIEIKRAVSCLIAILMVMGMTGNAWAYLFAIVKTESDFTFKDGELYFQTEDAEFKLSYTAESQIPEGASLAASVIPVGSEEYDSYLAAAAAALLNGRSDTQVASARFYDLFITDADGNKIEPNAGVDVRLSMSGINPDNKISLVHFPGSPSVVTEPDRSPEILRIGEDVILHTDPVSSEPEIDADPFRRSADNGKNEFPPKNAEIFGHQSEAAGAVRALDGVLFEDEAVSENVLPEVEVIPVEIVEGSLLFRAEGFSVFGVIETTIEKLVLASDGRNYRVSVTYTTDSGIPENADLAVEEITEDVLFNDKSCDDYVADAVEALGWEEGSVAYARIFDISIVDEEGRKVEISAPVRVKVELADMEDGSDTLPQVVHFADDDFSPIIVPDVAVLSPETGEESCAVSFETDGFSVYAIVKPQPPQSGNVISIDELDGQDFFISVTNSAYGGSTYYLKNNTVDSQIGETPFTLIEKTAANDKTQAAAYRFEKIEGEDNKFLISCENDNAVRKYIQIDPMDSNYAHAKLSDAEDATVFTIEPYEDSFSAFCTKPDPAAPDTEINYYLNLKGNGTDNGFQGYFQLGSSCKLDFTYPNQNTYDPFRLHMKSFGIVFYKTGITGAALNSNALNGSSLKSDRVFVQPDIVGRDEVLFVALDNSGKPTDGAKVIEWTFEYASGNDYFISTYVDGMKYYLLMGGDGKVTLQQSENPPANAAFTLKEGTGENAGRYQLVRGAYKLYLSNGDPTKGFIGSKKDDWTWMYLVRETDLLYSQDFVPYTAQKADMARSASEVVDGDEVILYTRIWNENKLEYEFYAVDHDGKLIRVYESGDVIQWVGSSPNTAVWTFRELQSDGEFTDYLELQNSDGQYLQPQIQDGQILKIKVGDELVGINMPGRVNNEHYSKLLLWDENYFMYAGLKPENGRLVSTPMGQSFDFYFAKIPWIHLSSQP